MLFRAEVFNRQRQGVQGQISLAQPVPVRLLSAAAATLAGGIVLFLVLGTYAQHTEVSGHLVPVSGLASIVAPSSGVLTTLHVAEGEQVKAGDVLATIDIPRATPQAGQIAPAMQNHLAVRNDSLQQAGQARLRELDAQLSGLAKQIGNLTQQIERVQGEISLRRQQIDLARDTLQRYESLMDERYVSGLQVQQQRSLVIEQQIALEQMHRQQIELQRQLADAQQARIEQQAIRDRAAAENVQQMAVLEQETLQTLSSSAIALTAPIDGVVSAQMFKPGEQVKEGQAVMNIIAGDGRLEARLLVPSRAIGSMRPGARVVIRYQAYPYQHYGRFSGRISRIGRSALDRTVLADITGQNSDEPHYHVAVTLDRQHVMVGGNREALRPGLQLHADVLGERRRLWQWMLDPARSIAANIQS